MPSENIHVNIPDIEEVAYSVNFSPPLKPTEVEAILTKMMEAQFTFFKFDETCSKVLPFEQIIDKDEREEAFINQFSGNCIYDLVEECSKYNVKVNGYIIDYVSYVYGARVIKIEDSEIKHTCFLLNDLIFQRAQEVWAVGNFHFTDYNAFTNHLLKDNVAENPRFSILPDNLGRRHMFSLCV